MADRRPSLLADYHEMIWYELDDGGGMAIPALRDRIETEKNAWHADAIQALEAHDGLLADYIRTADLDDIWPGLLEDRPDKPPEQWWWHLGAIRRGEFAGDYPGK